MKTILLSVFGAMLFTVSLAQFNCASETFRKYCNKHNHVTQTEQEANLILYDNILTRQGRSGGTDPFTLPVVVHIIHQNGAENISDESVELGIERLNEAFSNSAAYNTPDGVNTQIQFCLARQDENGDLSSGITRVSSNLTDHFVPSQSELLKNLIRWNTELYVNIWVVASITRDPDQTGVIGYATFPASHGTAMDGLVVEAATFSSSDFITVLVHEMGHYLGLYHTFQDGCPNNDCLISGDRVCDTPPDNFLFDQSCNPTANSCSTDDDDLSLNNPYRPIGQGGLGDQQDDISNYMDYTGINCFDSFTTGQSQRMQATLESIRTSLLNSVACYPPCENPMTINASASGNSMNSGESITFSDQSTGNSSREWRVDGAVASSNSTFIFDETNQGTYLVELYIFNDEPGCSLSMEFQIEVFCPVTASFNSLTDYISPGDEGSFENTSLGALTYTWYVDNAAVSSNENLNYIFNNAGIYFIQLEAQGPTCSVFSESQLVNVGLCSSGNEVNTWVLYPSGGSAQGLNFNSNEVVAYENNFLEYSEGKSSISDENGNLLFTSNGATVWDRNFNPLPDGTNLSGHFSARDGALFVKDPASANRIYLFTQDAQENSFANGVRYSIIDITLNNGLGDIIPGQKNIFISSTNNECLTAVKHCNTDAFWLVTKNNILNQIESYLVDENGLNPIPVSSPAGPQTPGLGINRDFAVTAESGMIYNDQTLYTFNNSTGECEIIHVFDDINVLQGEFSPNGKYLYLLIDLLNTTGILQIDLTLDPDLFIPQAYSLSIGPGALVAVDIQQGPDGKIYLPLIFGSNIASINNPNAPGELVEIDDTAIAFSGLINSLGNYFHAYISGAEFTITGNDETCINIPESYTLNNQCFEFDTNWELPDGGSILSENNGAISVEFELPGTYRIVCNATLSCGPDSDTLFVLVQPGLNVNLGPDINICQNDPLTLDAGPGGLSYLWQDGSTNQTLDITSAGIYSVQVESESGCTYTDQITVSGPISGIINLGPDDNLCNNEPIMLYAGDDFVDYVWQDGSTGPFYQVYEGGTYTVTASMPCDASDSITIDECGHSINVEEHNHSHHTVYPNPADQFLTLLGDFQNASVKVDIFDTRGRLVYSTTANLKVNTIPTAGFESGLYILRIHSEKKVDTINFVVQH